MKILEIIKDLCSRPLVLSAASMAAGILAGDSGGIIIFLFLAILLLFCYRAYITSAKPNIRNKRLAVIFLICLSFLTGVFRIRDTLDSYTDISFPDKALKETILEGEISDISYGKEQYTIILDDPQVKTKNTDDIIPEGRILVYSGVCPGKAGDRIAATGTLYSFNAATNYGQFDQRKYYMAKGIVYKLYADDIGLLEENRDIIGSVKKFLMEISMDFQTGLSKVFDEKDKGILNAMLVGNRTELDDSTKGLYQRMGIAHVLSISGLHITLIGLGLFNLLMLLTRRLRFSVLSACLFIYLYGILTGFSVSTERAVIMLTCMLLARLLGEAYDGQSAAGLAAMIILLFNPLDLFEAGFQLSFVAVFGIFAGNEIRRKLKIKSKVLVFMIPALSAQIATFPIILASYYSFSPYSVIANIVLLPFMPVIVASGFLSGLLGAAGVYLGSGVLLSLAEISAGPAHYMLAGYEKASLILQELPGADIITGCPETWKCMVYYVILFMLVFLSGWKKIKGKPADDDKNQTTKKYAAVFVLSMLVNVCLLTYRGDVSDLQVSFIDVGQGLSVYIEADGQSILADGGSSNVKNVGKYRIEPFLLWKGVDEIDYCVISHTDDDHISGIQELMEDGRIAIKNLIIGINYEDNEPLIVLAREKGINVIKVKAGDIIGNNADLFSSKEEDNILRVLSPDSEFIYEDKNQASLVMEIKYMGLSMLFTGDSDIYAESEYIKYLKGEKINILQCPHHGSKYSSSELLLDTITPDVTVISCSKNNVYGHPAHETLERLENVESRYYVTSVTGMVTIEYKGDETFQVLTYNKIKN